MQPIPVEASSTKTPGKFTIFFLLIIVVLVTTALFLQYQAIGFLSENTQTGKIHRMKIKKNDKHILLENSDVKPLIISSTTTTTTTVKEAEEEEDQNRNHHQQETTENPNKNNHNLLHPQNPQDSNSINEFLHQRSFNNRLLLIPVNSGYLDFGLNLLCSLEKISSSLVSSDEAPLKFYHHQGGIEKEKEIGTGYTFVAMDEQVEEDLIKMKLPVFRDPDMPFVSSKSAEWANPKFHHLVCTKLFPVLRALRQNISVVLSDADIVFRKDPLKYFLNRNHLDMIFSIGSCHRDLYDNLDLVRSGDGLAKLNTGFYLVSNTKKKVLNLFEDALKRCIDSNKGREAGEGDQPAMNAVLDENIRKYQQGLVAIQIFNKNKNHNKNSNHILDESDEDPRVHYGFFDGCLFANGCIYFKHLCANSTSLDPASEKAIQILKKGGKMPHHKILMNVKKSEHDDEEEDGFIRRDDPVLVHANFLVGKKDKIKHLLKYGLWNEECLNYLKK